MAKCTRPGCERPADDGGRYCCGTCEFPPHRAPYRGEQLKHTKACKHRYFEWVRTHSL